MWSGHFYKENVKTSTGKRDRKCKTTRAFNTGFIEIGKKVRWTCFVQRKNRICPCSSSAAQALPQVVTDFLLEGNQHLCIKHDQNKLPGERLQINPPHPNQSVPSQINRGHAQHFTARIYFRGTWKEKHMSIKTFPVIITSNSRCFKKR